jgi:hypothetical protein
VAFARAQRPLLVQIPGFARTYTWPLPFNNLAMRSKRAAATT